MSISQAIASNIVLIVAVFFFVLFFAESGKRLGTAFFIAWFVVALSWAGWIVYVLVHFISKYW